MNSQVKGNYKKFEMYR